MSEVFWASTWGVILDYWRGTTTKVHVFDIMNSQLWGASVTVHVQNLEEEH